MEITKVRQLTASSGILIYPVIPLTYRFLNHPSSKLRRIGRPRTTLRGIYIIFEIIYRFSPSIMIPSSRRSALGPPLRLQWRAAKLLEITEMDSERLRANALVLPSISTVSRRPEVNSFHRRSWTYLDLPGHSYTVANRSYYSG